MFRLGTAAEDRGMLRDAARLYKQASAHGDSLAEAHLVRLLHTLYPGDQRPAGWVSAHAVLDDSAAVAQLLGALREAGATGQVTALLDRDPAAHARLDLWIGVAALLSALREVGAGEQVTTLRQTGHQLANRPLTSSPCTRRCPHAGFSVAIRMTSARTAAAVDGRPGRRRLV
jgi:hypothetical protein